MKRFFLTMVLLMIMVSTCILFFQWNGYSTGSAEESTNTEVKQTIALKHEGTRFFVTQELFFTADIPSSIMIKWPKEAEDFQCSDEQGENCLTKENGQYELKPINNKNKTLKIKYSFEQQNVSTYLLLKEWYPKLTSLKFIETHVKLTEKSFRNGKWISSYKDVAHKKLDYIDYYAFSGESQPPELIWTSERMNSLDYENVRIISTEKMNSEKLNLHFEAMNGFVTVMINNAMEPFQSDRLLITNTNSNKELKDAVFWSLLQQDYSDPTHMWLKEIAANILVNESNGSSKAKFGFQELKEGLTPAQLNQLKQFFIKRKGRAINVTQLDHEIGSITGFSSTFFLDNIEEEEREPLTLYSKKSIQFNEEIVQNVSYLLYKQKELISFEESLDSLGLDVKKIEENVFFTSLDGNTFRFYINQDYFIYNEENYGLLMKPVQKVGNKVYMDLGWFEKLFKVDVLREDKVLNIKEKTM
ncbi:hypothetical protein [Rossellomorea aquimaris]|uniref:hypothetical protein n=1 Tax=Rossellomorea aquimaris TaxID=189382 RepID=UPI0007D04EA7|nr:hypothetical protein [Rossellomorea aquimaris]